jgi:hypothetical protein
MNTTTAIDRELLNRTAFDILKGDLEGHGNVLSALHASALNELLDTLSGYCVGAERGRQAFGLPTGMGKTSAIVAFLAALHRLGYPVPVSVAGFRVEALCTLHRQLREHEVPEDWIGIKHADVQASVPSTGNESRLFQLVTHARVRLQKRDSDFSIFGEHEGTPRALCIYDESLMRSDSFAFSESSLRKGLALLRIDWERTADPLSLAVRAYLEAATETISAALTKLRNEGDTYRNGIPVDLAELEEHQIETYRMAIGRACGGLGGYENQLETLLLVSQNPLQVLAAEQGGGAVAVREAVPSALRNVVILDASTPVRELVRMDPTIRQGHDIPARDLKSFEAVQVHQLLAAGGRGSIEWSFKAKAREAAAVSSEVLDIIKQNTQAKGILVFSFLPRRGQVDVLAELKRDLARGGADLQLSMKDETQRRVRFLTWGQQEGLNGYEACDVVIMAGVLHRSHLDIAAAIKGQIGHLAEPTPGDRLREVVESEVAHVIFQGASRGSCRRVVNGRAQPMKLYLIHRNLGLKAILDKVMPNAQWFYPDPKFLKKAAGETRAARVVGELLAHLDGLDEAEDDVSTKRVKAAIGLTTKGGDVDAWKAALKLFKTLGTEWEAGGRGFVRGAARLGFISRA